MKLSKLDKEFIEFMVQWPEHRRVISLKIENDSGILRQTPQTWQRALLKNLAVFLYLLIEVALTFVKKAPPVTEVVFAFDTNVNNIEDRAIYFRHNLPEERVEIITFHSRLIRLVGVSYILRQLSRLAGFMIKSFVQPSTLSKEYVRIVRSCFLVHGYLLTSSRQVVFLCHPHRWDTTFQAAYLRERGYYVNLVATPYTPLSVYNKYLIADSIKLGDLYQVSEFKVYSDFGTCHHYELWPVARSFELVEHYAGKKRSDTQHTLGLYTQGFWLRTQIGKASEAIGRRLAEQEQELIRNIMEYLARFPDICLIVFPHPIERRHFQEKGKHQFGQLVSNRQVEISFDGPSSVYDFDRAGLGITTVSSSGFERLYLGFRTVFYIPHVSFMDLSISSPYNVLFTKNKEELFEKIHQLRPMSDEEFFDDFLK